MRGTRLTKVVVVLLIAMVFLGATGCLLQDLQTQINQWVQSWQDFVNWAEGVGMWLNADRQGTLGPSH